MATSRAPSWWTMFRLVMPTATATKMTMARAIFLFTCCSSRDRASTTNRKNVACTRSATMPIRTNAASAATFAAVVAASPGA